MAEYTSDELYDMTDEELDAAFKAAKAEEQNPQELFDEEETADIESGEEEDFEGEESEEEEEDDTESDEDLGEEESEESEEDDTPEEESEESPEEETAGTEVAEEDVVRKFRANGRDYEMSTKEILEQFPKFFGQAMDYTKKMQAIKPWRKTIDAIDQAGLKHDDINLAIDLLKGDKDAIAELVKQHKIDPIDLDLEEAKYVRKDYGRNDNALDLQDVLTSIEADPEYAVTHQILSKGWDDASWKVLSNDPEKIKLLHIDVKSGVYNKLAPLAEKIKIFDNAQKSDLDYYMEAAKEYWSRTVQEQTRQLNTRNAEKERALQSSKRVSDVQAQESKRAATKAAASKRKAAAPSGRTSVRSSVDYLDDSDEAFEEWYKRLEEQQ